MQLYGPFALTPRNIERLMTRVLPGVCLLCDGEGHPEQVVYSSFHIAEMAQQWEPYYALFYFCYTCTGSEAEQVSELIKQALHFAALEQSNKKEHLPN